MAGTEKIKAPARKRATPARRPNKSLSSVAADLLSRALAPGADEIGALIRDQVAHFRARNLDRLARKWEQELSKRRISPDALEALPFDAGFRLFDEASKEESEDVLDLWAALLASAMDPKSDVHAHKVLISVLKELEGPDAVLLDLMWMRASLREEWESADELDRDDMEQKKQYIENLKVSRWESLTTFSRQVAVQNVMRLGCATYLSTPSLSPPGLSLRRLGFSNELLSVENELEEAMQRVENEVSSAISLTVGVRESSELHSERGERDYLRADEALTLTSLGRTLMAACREKPWSNAPHSKTESSVA